MSHTLLPLKKTEVKDVTSAIKRLSLTQGKDPDNGEVHHTIWEVLGRRHLWGGNLATSNHTWAPVVLCSVTHKWGSCHLSCPAGQQAHLRGNDAGGSSKQQKPRALNCCPTAERKKRSRRASSQTDQRHTERSSGRQD